MILTWQTRDDCLETRADWALKPRDATNGGRACVHHNLALFHFSSNTQHSSFPLHPRHDPLAMASSSSARARSSSGQTAMAGPSTSSLPPVTPRRKYKRKSAAMAPLSSKQFDKMTRQLLMVQQSTRKNGETLEEDSGEGATGDSPAIVPPADVLAALNLNDAGGAGADSDSIVALGQPGKHRPAVTSTSTTTRHLENGQTVHETEEVKKSQATEHWLRRIRGTGTVGGAGGASASVKGPDGLSMARAAAKGLQGRRQGE